MSVLAGYRALLLLVVAVACDSEGSAGRAADRASVGSVAPPDAAATTDDFGDSLPKGRDLRRIVSLNPAVTELVFAVGAATRLIGRGHWDEWPAQAREVADAGPDLSPNVELVLSMRPDLVILHASNENRLAASQFRKVGIATMSIRVDRVADLRRLAGMLDEVLGGRSARSVADSVERSVHTLQARTKGLRPLTVVMPAWESPVIVIGRGSHLTELVEAAGGRNAFDDVPAPSANVTFEEVLRRDPDALLVNAKQASTIRASERWRALRAVRTGRVVVYDTTLVGRASVTMGAAAWHLARLFHGVVPP